MTPQEQERKNKLERHVKTLKAMREVVIKDENWESMKSIINALTAGAMAIQRIIREDFEEGDEDDE